MANRFLKTEKLQALIPPGSLNVATNKKTTAMRFLFFFLFTILFFFSCKQKTRYEIIIRNGMIYDGNGGEPYKADIAINADTIAFIGDLSNESAKNETDAKGMAIAPGFINMLSWS